MIDLVFVLVARTGQTDKVRRARHT